jgi:anhydro-N-acetylmuramic acid kinase
MLVMSKSDMEMVIGLMSGTSLDGVDAAIILTDGDVVELTDMFMHLPYGDEFRAKLQGALETKIVPDELVDELTEIHAELVNMLLDKNNLTYLNIKLIGFHGQTIEHRPDDGYTLQIGDGELLAKLTKIDVVNDFRSADVAAGGQGAPLVPVYHRALMDNVTKPVAILNLGGVGNVTFVGENDELVAFDTGPANALMDDVIFERTGKRYDENGALADKGAVDDLALEILLSDDYFMTDGARSLDRDYWNTYQHLWKDLSLEDALATLSAFTACSVADAVGHFPELPETWYVAGGGVHNDHLMKLLAEVLEAKVLPVTDLGVNPDAVEAQAFAYLAMRSVKGLYLTLPTTTGVKTSSATGGVFCPV